MRYVKIKRLVIDIIEPSINYIKKTRGRQSMPYKEIETILKIFYPRTKYEEAHSGFHKHVFIIHSNKKKLVLKIGRNRRRMRRDYETYHRLPKRIKNRYFAKIYWQHDLFMLQKYGREKNVPKETLSKLKRIGKDYGLKDVRPANIMKFGDAFKIVDAERI